MYALAPALARTPLPALPLPPTAYRRVHPLELSISGHPRVPSNASGNVYMQLPIPAPNALACDDAVPPPADVLGGCLRFVGWPGPHPSPSS